MELPGVAAAVAAPDRIPQPAQRGQGTTATTSASALADLATRDLQNARRLRQLDEQLDERIKRDKSDRARIGRRRLFIRALWGEFFCTLLFFTPVFGVVANSRVGGYEDGISALAIAATGGFQAIANIFAFSSVSGAHFNPAISFALWLTGKLSNRKLAGYIIVQLLASIISMCIVAAMFYSNEMTEIYAAVVVQPPVKNVSLGKVFATEFFLTFILTYVAFTVVFEDAEARKKETMSIKGISDSVGLTLYASTPQSKAGFAPFSIGLTVFSLSLIGGSSGGAFNPARLFGPAIFSGVWTNVWLYWLAELAGSSCAGLMVHAVANTNTGGGGDEEGLGDLLKDLGRRSEMPPINPLVSSITEV